MKILIIEDEPLAAAQLAALLAGIRTDSKIVAVCDTIASSVRWIKNNPMPDLAFMDIQLGDGLSFEIFRKTTFNIPVIFTTAYDQYTLQAFKVNSIDYLLKPVDKAELTAAIEKFEQTKPGRTSVLSEEQLQVIISSIGKKEYKKRFLVKVGYHLKSVDTADILFFYSLQKGTYLKNRDNKTFLLDQTLEMAEQLVDPEKFFRINRKYLISIDSITDVSVFSNSRLKLKVTYADEDDFLVARERVKAFKSWLEGEQEGTENHSSR